MTERLDFQRPPSKWHARRNSRWMRRGYAIVPHVVWGDPVEDGGGGGGGGAGPLVGTWSGAVGGSPSAPGEFSVSETSEGWLQWFIWKINDQGADVADELVALTGQHLQVVQTGGLTVEYPGVEVYDGRLDEVDFVIILPAVDTLVDLISQSLPISIYGPI